MSAIDEMQKEIVETQEFVRERLGPVTKELTLMREEQERLAGEVRRVLEHDRSVRRDALLGRTSNDRVRVRGGKLDGFDLVDLAVMRSLLAAQQARRRTTTREPSAPGRRASPRRWTPPRRVRATSWCPRRRRASCGRT